MIKKHKFIDTLKSWLVTLGVASVFGLVALGVNASKTYTKTSAYNYLDNGDLIFQFTDENNNTSSYFNNLNIIRDYVIHHNNLISCDWFLSTIVDGETDEDFEIYSITYSSSSNRLFFNGEDSENDYVRFDYSNSSYEFVLATGALEDISSPFGLYLTPSMIGYQELRNYVLSYNAPQESGNFLTALTSFMQLLGGAIVQLAQPVANGVTEFARDLFIDNNHLSILGGVIGIFAGIALAVGITTKVYTWVTSLGN